MQSFRHIVVVVTLLTLVSAPAVANACSVCFSAKDEARSAFLYTTILLSLLPLAAIGGTVYFLWRRHKKRLTQSPSQQGS